MKVLLALFLLAVLAFGADLIAENVAEGRMEQKLSSSIEEGEDFEVDVRGGSFLLQALGGRFEEVVVTSARLSRQGVHVQDVSFTLEDVEFSSSDLLGGRGEVTVGGGRGSATVAGASILGALRRQDVDARVNLNGGAEIVVAGETVPVQDIGIEGTSLRFAAPGLPPVSLDLPELPGRVVYGGARVDNGSLVIALDVKRGRLSF